MDDVVIANEPHVANDASARRRYAAYAATGISSMTQLPAHRAWKRLRFLARLNPSPSEVRQLAVAATCRSSRWRLSGSARVDLVEFYLGALYDRDEPAVQLSHLHVATFGSFVAWLKGFARDGTSWRQWFNPRWIDDGVSRIKRSKSVES